MSHTVHDGYTVVAPIEDEAALRALLAGYDPHALFEPVKSVHFTTIAIIPKMERSGEILPASLLLATSFCGPSKAHEDELLAHVGPQLREIFACCEDFSGNETDAQLRRWLRKHRLTDTFYTGMQYLTREDVLAQHALRADIQTYLDAHQAADTLPKTPRAIVDAIQRDVGVHHPVARKSWAPDRTSWWVLQWRTVLVVALAVLILSVLLGASGLALFVHPTWLKVAVAGGWLAVVLGLLILAIAVWDLHNSEKDQTYVAPRQPDDWVSRNHATQNHPVINEFTISGPVKEGWSRAPILRAALWAIERVACGIPGVRPPFRIPTVAAARWIALDRGRRLVFISNYTNASEPYVRDFIDTKAGAMNINVSFGFGRGYPKTFAVYLRGALEDQNAFIYVVDANQRPTEFWFCPYKNISVDNIRINREICEGVFATYADDAAAQEWLHKL